MFDGCQNSIISLLNPIKSPSGYNGTRHQLVSPWPRQAAPSSPELSFRSGRPRPAGAQRPELRESMGISWFFCGVLMFFLGDGTSKNLLVFVWLYSHCISILDGEIMLNPWYLPIFQVLFLGLPSQRSQRSHCPKASASFRVRFPSDWVDIPDWVTKHRPKRAQMCESLQVGYCHYEQIEHF